MAALAHLDVSMAGVSAEACPPYGSGRTADGVEWQVHWGDAYGVLQGFPSDWRDCVVTSPPYYSLRDYKAAGQIGLEDSVASYVDAIARVMGEVHRILAPSGVLFLNLGDTYYSGKGRSHGTDPKSSRRRFGLRPVDRSGGLGEGLRPKTAIGIPWRVAIEMLRRDWVLRSTIIWHRKHCLPEAVRDRPRRSYEYVFMFVKSRQYYFERGPLRDAEQEDMWTIIARPRPTNGLDTSPFPDELVRRCLTIGCPAGGTVLDPFAGSGTTLRVAVGSGRRAAGIDVNERFCRYMVDDLARL